MVRVSGALNSGADPLLRFISVFFLLTISPTCHKRSQKDKNMVLDLFTGCKEISTE